MQLLCFALLSSLPACSSVPCWGQLLPHAAASLSQLLHPEAHKAWENLA